MNWLDQPVDGYTNGGMIVLALAVVAIAWIIVAINAEGARIERARADKNHEALVRLASIDPALAREDTFGRETTYYNTNPLDVDKIIRIGKVKAQHETRTTGLSELLAIQRTLSNVRSSESDDQ